jgi:ubiquitin C-terminal hydrolase
MYVINRKWLKSWKEYVNYSYMKRKNQQNLYYIRYSTQSTEFTPDESKKPGPIDNWRILVPLSEFLNDGDLSEQTNLVVRHDLSQREDIKIVNKQIWEFFYSKYGGGPEIIKPWIKEGYKNIVELFYRKVTVMILPDRKTLKTSFIHSLKSYVMYVSRTNKLKDLKRRYWKIYEKNILIKQCPLEETDKEKLQNVEKIENQPTTEVDSDIDISKFRLWKIDSNSSIADFKKFLMNNITEVTQSKKLLDPESILEYLEYVPEIDLVNLEFADTDICIIEHFSNESDKLFEVKEIQIKDGKCDKCSKSTILKFFCACGDASYCTQFCKETDYWHNRRCRKVFELQEESLKASQSSRNGLVGLQNLGNTCFMNTSLQCMSNCYELTQYFLKNYYTKDINLENPIGTQGVLAKAYSNLLKNLWYGQSAVYSPWNFKSAISNFQSMFSGYQQHDTQEFLNYLLDGLHEDLNKVLKKPIVEKDDSNKEDKIKAREQWIGFLRRNQSVLVDLLYGQYKSTLYCPNPECGNISTTFDPFLSLSLPLLSKGEKYEITCFFIFYDIKIKPIQIDLNFYFDTSVMALRNKIAKLLEIHPYSFIILKMDQTGDLDFFPCSSIFIKNLAHQNLHKNQQSFFLFQIDPKIYYSRENNSLIDSDCNQLRDFSTLYECLNKNKEEKSHLWQEDYEEDQTGITTDSVCYYSFVKEEIIEEMENSKQGQFEEPYTIMKINTDNNNGLNSDWIKLVLNIKKYDDSYPTLRKKLIFPRVVYVNKKWTLKYLHKFILNYFSKIIKDFTNQVDNHSEEDLWETYFPDLEQVFSNNSELHLTSMEHKKLAYPYLIRIKSVYTDQEEKCVFCNSISCKDCLLPYTDNLTIDQYLNKIPKNNNSRIDNTFYYLTDKQRRNSGIKNKDFILDITWLNQYVDSVRKLNERDCFEIEVRKAIRGDSIDIRTCFRNFVKIEKLEEDNEWFCSKCKKHQRADKKLEIYRSPHILIIHLKRFRNRSKIDNVVEFPINGLDISNYVICKDEGLPLTYDLFAIANHYGGLGGGHYVSYAKNPIDNNWYCFNDSSVSRLNEEQLISSAAYVLFYRRRDLGNYLNLEELYTKPFEDFENIAQIEKLKIETPPK